VSPEQIFPRKIFALGLIPRGVSRRVSLPPAKRYVTKKSKNVRTDHIDQGGYGTRLRVWVWGFGPGRKLCQRRGTAGDDEGTRGQSVRGGQRAGGGVVVTSRAASHGFSLAFSQSMGGRAIGASGGGPRMAATDRGRRTYPPGPLTLRYNCALGARFGSANHHIHIDGKIYNVG
jgi:hypothetical protein